MKLRLPHKFQAALLAAIASVSFTTLSSGTAFAEENAAKSDGEMGLTLFMGDSITHGVLDAAYRWQLFKTFVDNGVYFSIDGPISGYNSTPADEDNKGGSVTYRGVGFVNEHYAKASGRSYEMIQGASRYDNIKVETLGQMYDISTGSLLIGTNDLLSDGGYTYDNFKTKMQNLLGGTVSYSTTGTDAVWTWQKGSTMGNLGTIIDSMNLDAGDEFYVLSIPTWATHKNNNDATIHAAVAGYNGLLQQWVNEYNSTSSATVKYVDVNKGMVDLTSSTPFFANKAFFNNGEDGLHPSEQGSLIMAGNVARAMGIGGRTAALTRSATTEQAWSHASAAITFNPGDAAKTVEGAQFTITDGYTIDFTAVFGDGSGSGGWLDADKDRPASGVAKVTTFSTLSNSLNIQVGDGTHTGTLKLAEGYVAWSAGNGDMVLYCQNNSVSGNEALRIAYREADSANNILGGYYVWKGDMLIGQGLASVNGSLNGIQLSITGSNNVGGTISNLSWADTAYAPTTELFSSTPLPDHDNPTPSSLNIDFTTGATTGYTGQYATGANAAKVVQTSVTSSNWFAPVGANHSGDLEVEYKGITGPKNNMFGIVVSSGSIAETGNVSVVIDGGSTLNYGDYDSSGAFSIFGSYQGSITQKLSIEINEATLTNGVLMGVVKGTNSIGGVDLRINSGASIGGDVIGGNHSPNGTIDGNVDITITGGSIAGSVYGGNMDKGTISGSTNVVITGGIISGGVYGGNKTGGTIGGTSSVTIMGNLPYIGGNISADTVTLQNVTADPDHSDTFDKYRGNIRANTVVLDQYKVERLLASVETQSLVLKNGTKTTIHNLTLTACTITVEDTSEGTIAGTLTLGNTATYTGNLTLQDGLVIDMVGSGGGSGYSDGENGFREAGNYTVMQRGASGSLDVDTTKLTGAGALSDSTFTYDPTAGTLTAAISGETDTFFVNSGTVVYGGPKSAKDITTAKKVQLQPTVGATLELAQNLTTDCTAGIVVTSSAVNPVVRIDKFESDGETRIVLAQSQLTAKGDVKLAGNGTFALATNTFALPEHVSLDSDWAGIIRVSTASEQKGFNLSALANANSWIEFNGVTGWTTNWADTNTQNIMLSDPENGVAWYCAANTTKTDRVYTATYTGKFAGDGTFRVNPDKLGYTFTGDISAWTGKFLNDDGTSGHTSTLTFEGAANTINAAIENTGNQMKLVVNNNAIFNRNVTGISAGLTVANGHHATFNGTTGISGASTIGGTVYNNGNMTIAGTATINLQGNESSFDLYNGAGSTNAYDGAGGFAGNGHLASENAQYYIIKGGEGSSLSGAFEGTAATQIGNDLVMTGAKNAGLYYVNTQVTYGSDVAENTTGYVVADGATFTVGADVGTVLGTTTGTGTFVVSENATIDGGTSANPYKTNFAGTLKIADGKTLQLGDNKATDAFDLTAVEDVIIGSNSWLKLQQIGMSLNNVTTTGGTAHLYFNDTYSENVDSLHITGVTTIVANSVLEVGSGWKNHLSIDKLAGTGSLHMTSANENEKRHYYIGGTAEGSTLNQIQLDVGTLNVNGDTSVTKITGGNGSNVVVAEGTTLSIEGGGAKRNNSEVYALDNRGTINLKAANGDIRFDGTANDQVFNMGHLNIDGASGITYMLTAGAVNYTTDIAVKSLSGGGTDHILQVSDCYTGGSSGQVIDLVLGENQDHSNLYTGKIQYGIGTSSAKAGSGMNLVLKDEYVASQAVLETLFNGNNSQSANITVDTQLAKVKGITGTASSTHAMTVSGTAAENNRILEFVGAEGYTYSGALGSNLDIAYTGTGSQSFTGDLSAMNGAVTASAGTLTLDNSGATAGSLASVTVDGGTLVLDDMNVSGAVTLGSGTLDLRSDISTGAFSLNGGTLKFADADSLSVTGTFNIGGSSVLDLSNFTVSTPANITLASTTAGVTGNLGDITLQGFSPLTGYDTALKTIGTNLVLTFTPVSNPLIWDHATDATWSANSGTLNWHVEGAGDGSSAFTTDADVRFIAGKNNEVSLDEAITAGNMTLDEGVTVKLNGNGNSLTVGGTLAMGDNSTLVVKPSSRGIVHNLGDLQITGSASINSALSAADGSWNPNVNIGGIQGKAGSVLNLKTSSWVTVATVYNMNGGENSDFHGDIVLRQEQTNTNGVRMIAMNINSGAATQLADSVVTFSNVGNNLSRVGLGVNADATVQGLVSDPASTVGNHVIFSGAATTDTDKNFDNNITNGNVAHTLTINTAGGDYTTRATVMGLVNLVKEGAGSQTFNSDLSAMNGAVTASAGTLTLDNSGDNKGSLASVLVNGGTLVLDDMNVSGAVTLGSGTLDLLSDTSTGAFALNGGTLKFADAGSLAITGSLNIGGSSVLDLSRITVSGPSNITLASTTAGVTGNLGNITLQGFSPLTGYDAALQTIDNNLVLTFTPQYDGLIWNKTDGDWSNQSTDANWHTAADPDTSVAFVSGKNVRFDSLANGHTVTLTDNITAGTVEIMDGVTVTIKDQNKTLNGTLKGSGTYALASEDSSLPGSLNVKDSGWTGTVKLSSVGIANIDLNSYGHAGSKVEFDGVSGHFLKDNSAPFEPTLVLSGGGLTVNNAYSGTEYIFAGGVEGAGNINAIYNSGTANNNKFTFTGSVKDWIGAVTVASGKGVTLKFAGAADTVNATIGQASGGGTINLEVGNGAGTFSTTFNKAVSASKLEVKTDASATINQTSSLGNLVGPGNVVVAENTTLTVGSATGEFANVTVKNGATLAITGAGSTDYKMRYTLDGGTLTNTGNDTGNSHIQNDQITLTKDSTISGTGNFYMLAGSYGKTELHLDTYTLEKTGTNEITMYSTEVSGGGTLKITNGSLNITRHTSDKPMSLVDANIVLNKGGAESLKGDFNLAANHSISSTVSDARMTANVAMQGATTLGAEENCSLTASGVLSGSGPITKTGNGIVTLSGTNTYTGNTTINAGTLVAGSSSALGTGAVTLSSGTLDLTTAVTAGALTMSGGTLALDGENWYTASTGNINLTGGTLDLTGLDLSSGAASYTLATASNGTVSASGVSFRLGTGYDPSLYSLDVQDNNLVLTFAQPVDPKNLIWDNAAGNNTWDAGASANWHEAESTDHIAFTNRDNATFDSASADATVTMSGAVTAGTMTVGSGADVTIVTGTGNTLSVTNGITIEQGGTLAQQGNGLSGTLQGDGTYVLPTNTGSLGNVQLGNDWEGTVQISGNMENFYINNLAREDSWVEAKGVTGYPRSWASGVSGYGDTTCNLKLTDSDDGTAAFTFTAGSLTARYTAKFTGDIVGDGTFAAASVARSQDAYEDYEFSGNISGWNGTFRVDRGRDTVVSFTGDADVVNAAIDRNGHALGMKIGTADAAQQTTFNSTVDVSTLTLANEGSSATFMGNTEIGTLSGAGTLVVDGAKTTTTIGSGSNFTGDITLRGGTLDLTSALTGVGEVNLGGSAAATLKLAGGGNALTSTSSITLGDNLTLDLSNYSSVETGGSVTLATATDGYGSSALDSVSLTGLNLEEGYKARLSVENTTDLVLTVRDESENLIWLDPAGTWTARRAWYESDKTTPASFENGDSVTIVGSDFDGGTTIRMIADASARNMTVTKDEGVTDTTVTIKDTVNQNRLAAKNLTLEGGVTLVTDTQMEVTETAQLGSGTEWTLNSPKDAAISAAISSTDATASITKQGDNTLTLTGDNSGYTGSIEVTAGTLAAQGADSLGKGTVIMGEGTELSLENRGAMNGGSLTLGDGSTISFLGDTELTLTGTLTLGDGVTWDLSRYGFDRPAEGQIGTAILINVDDFGDDFGTNPVITVPGIVHDAQLKYEDGSVILTYTMDAQGNLYWKGGTGTWNTDSDNRSWYPMKEGGDLTSFYNGDNVTFDDRAAISSVTLTEDITAGTVTVENGTRVTLQDGTGNATLTADEIAITGTLGTHVNVNADTVSIADSGTWIVSGDKDRTFAGNLTGTGTLAKSGSGDLELSHDNSDFTGDIQLNEGSITVADADALGTGTTIAMGDGTELKGSGTIAAVNMGGKTIEVTNSGANATVSANLDVDQGTILTFAGNGTLDVTGTMSGSGTITQSGYGVTNIGNLNDFNGTLNVDHGTLVMQSAYVGDTTTSLSVKQGATLTFAPNVTDDGTVTPLTVHTLNLLVGSYLDVSNITLGNVKLDSGDISNAAVLALVTSNITYTFPHSLEQGPGGKGATDIRMIEGVMLSGTEGLGIPENNNLRLRYGYIDNKLVVYVQTTNADGKFWNDPDADGKWENTENPQTLSWNATQDGIQETNTWYHSYYSNTKNHVVADDAYFMKKYYDKDGNQISANIDIVGTNAYGNPESIDYAGDVIFGKDTIYTINGYSLALSVTPNGGYGQKETTITSSFVVDENAQVTLNAGLNAGEGNFVHVKEGANFVINATQGDHSSGNSESVYIAYGHNAGYTEINADGFNLISYTNDGTMKVTHTEKVLMPGYPEDPFASTLETFTNMETGVVTFSSDYLTPFPSWESYDPYIYNDGKVYFQSADHLGVDMIDQIAVRGRGGVYTLGDKGVIFDVGAGYPAATVQASILELDAASTTFNYGVDITDTTTVKAGKDAYFYGGTGVGGPGSLGEVALEDASSITFGPRVEVDYYGQLTGVIKQSYDMGYVTAGADSVLTVQKGATVTMDGFNAASGVPAGEIVVGSMPAGAPSDYSEAASLLIDGPAAVDTVTVLNGTATVNGNASINQIMQDDGVLTLKADSVLNGTDGNGGTVTGGELVLAGGKTLDQNAVIDVRNVGQAESGGTYTVSGGENSRIDASDLELTVNREKTLYREVVKVQGSVIISEDTSNIKSGFMASGEEFVKLFDMATGTTLTANNEAIYHASATGMMTLIGNDNYTKLQIQGGSDLSNFIGYGYLFTKDLALKTYYVRDTYTEADQEHQLEADRVTLSNIIDASADTEHPDGQLENVVFDKTEYNTGFSPYNGTLTVDEDTSVDLFSVSADAKAAINIIDGTTVTADAGSPGMAGSLDLEGEGVYEITNRNDLGQNIAVRDELDPNTKDWDGTVRVTGTSTDLNIDNMYADKDGDASTIEFKNWDGALDGGEHENNAKIVLTSTQDSPTAMKLTGEDDIDYTFTNTVTGSGSINHAEGGNVAMTFSGDTAGWNGTYEQNASTEDSLTFTGGTKVSANVTSVNGSMDLTYGGTVEEVAGNVNAYSGGDTPTTMNVTYTGADKAVTGGITSDAQSQLTLTVGDGKNPTTATFTSTFTGTENATMAVKDGSKAVIGKNAELLRVLGDEGSDVVVNEGSTLSLASTNPETGYSEFHDLTNEGTIEMMANGGEIHLVDDTAEGNTYNLGNLVLTDPVGTATIETSGVEGKTTNVNISGLVGPKSSNQVLELMNGNATGTVNYNLGNTDDTKDLNGTIAYGVNGGNGAVTNLVIQDNGNSAASAVLETRFANANDPAEANIVVDTHNGNVAHVLGLSSDANSFTDNKTMVVSGSEGGNKTLEITGAEEYDYAGGLGKNLDITYSGDGKQTFEGGADDFSGKVTVENDSNAAGVLEILNASSVSITDLTIGTNNTLDLNDGGGNVGTAVVSGSVVAKGNQADGYSKVDGSLTLGKDASYDVSAAGGVGGLDLGGALTITQGATLSSGDIAKIYQMEIGDMYDLAFDVTMFNGSTTASGFEDKVPFGDPIDASTLFGGDQFWKGEYYVCFSGAGTGGNGSNVGTVYLYKATPEPTTSTLSLLALAALAARRRRK